MNILLSLLIYNPIEAYTLILLCDIITGNDTKFNKKNIATLWVFGTVNFIIQYLSSFAKQNGLFCILMFVTCYAAMPVSLKYFYYIISYNKISIVHSVVTIFISCIVIMIVSLSVSAITQERSLLFNNSNSIKIEFIINFLIHFLQIAIYTFIKKRINCYEKCCKRTRK